MVVSGEMMIDIGNVLRTKSAEDCRREREKLSLGLNEINWIDVMDTADTKLTTFVDLLVDDDVTGAALWREQLACLSHATASAFAAHLKLEIEIPEEMDLSRHVIMQCREAADMYAREYPMVRERDAHAQIKPTGEVPEELEILVENARYHERHPDVDEWWILMWL